MTPRRQLVLLPQMGGYAAKVARIIVFLATCGIPVTFRSVMSVLGSNQLANLLSFTPGGVGVNQAFNAFALDSYTDSTTATAYLSASSSSRRPSTSAMRSS
jgi:hypothetical protein